MKIVYSSQERIEMISIYGEVGKCACDVKYRYVFDLVAKFSETDSVDHTKKNNRQVLNEEVQIGVLETFVAEPISFLRTIAEYTRMSHEVLRKAVKLHKFHPYEMQIFQYLHEDDFDRRI